MHERPDPVAVDLSGGRTYHIHFAPVAKLGSLLAAAGLLPGPCIVVTDANVAEHWLAAVTSALGAWEPLVMVLPAGERTKSAASLQSIYDRVLRAGIDRQTPVIAVGGGVIGDLAGFAAATLLRGVPLVQVPTSLIAQVDSAIGGKTGINHAVGKNLVGAYCQPRLVCADPAVLATLPALEWTSGLAEVVKHALIADPAFAAFLDRHWQAVLARKPATVLRMIPWAAAVKAKVVSEDETEQGRRAILNFGHTFGHAIEHTAGYGQFTHGEAVALGMRAALTYSGRLHPDFRTAKAVELVRRIPVRHTLSSLACSMDDLVDAMQYDKKVQRGRLRLVVLRRTGRAYVTDQVSRQELAIAWQSAYL